MKGPIALGLKHGFKFALWLHRLYLKEKEKQTMNEDVRFCACKECGQHMILGFDNVHKNYVAICEACKTYQPIHDGDDPPFTS